MGCTNTKDTTALPGQPTPLGRKTLEAASKYSPTSTASAGSAVTPVTTPKHEPSPQPAPQRPLGVRREASRRPVTPLAESETTLAADAPTFPAPPSGRSSPQPPHSPPAQLMAQPTNVLPRSPRTVPARPQAIPPPISTALSAASPTGAAPSPRASAALTLIPTTPPLPTAAAAAPITMPAPAPAAIAPVLPPPPVVSYEKLRRDLRLDGELIVDVAEVLRMSNEDVNYAARQVAALVEQGTAACDRMTAALGTADWEIIHFEVRRLRDVANAAACRRVSRVVAELRTVSGNLRSNLVPTDSIITAACTAVALVNMLRACLQEVDVNSTFLLAPHQTTA